MAETKPTASATVKATSVQAKKSSNAISWIAPLVCIVAGYLIWRFVLGNPDGFKEPDPAGGFWPKHHKPKDALSGIYEGGIIVPLLIHVRSFDVPAKQSKRCVIATLAKPADSSTLIISASAERRRFNPSRDRCPPTLRHRVPGR